MHYTAPTIDDFQRLKDDLSLSSAQMADLFGLAGGNQWRKYTGGAAPREMSAQMLFYACARLELAPEQIERVLARMRAVGAEVALDALPAPRPRAAPAAAADLDA